MKILNCIFQNRNITNNTLTLFEATYKGKKFYITTDHGFGKATYQQNKQFSIDVIDIKTGIYDGQKNKYKYRYSQEKLNMLKPILTFDFYNILCNYFKNLGKIELGYDEIDVLHHEHSNIAIQVSKPTQIDMSFEDFDKLFVKCILNGSEPTK